MRTAVDAPIIVGADGSDDSLTAIAAAARQATAYGRPLRIIHAFNWLPTTPRDGLPWLRSHADSIIDEALRVATAAAPDATVSVHTLEGSPSTILLRAARTAALLVIRGDGLDAHAYLGADCGVLQLAARAPCSVLVTRHDHARNGPIVVGVDRSPAAAGVLDFAFTAAATMGSALIVVQVVEPQAGPKATAHNLNELVDEVERRRWAYAVAAVVRARSGEPSQILREESARAGLLVVGPRGERLGRGLLGPVAQALLHHSAAPLIIVRGAAAVTRAPDVDAAAMVGSARTGPSALNCSPG